MKCPKCKIEMYNNCCMKCGYMPNGNSVIDNQENIEGIGKISNLDDIDKEQQLAYNDYIKANNDYKKHRNKKWLIVISITILVVAIIKIFFGTIEINNIFGYPSQKARYYELKINDKQISVSYKLRHKISIIPALINFNSYYLGNSMILDDDSGPFFSGSGKEQYLIDIKSYSCYYEKYQSECIYNDQIDKENNDTKYTKMIITRTTKPYEEVYKGDFIRDITPYIKKKGRYCIQIIAKYGLVETEIYFYFDSI